MNTLDIVTKILAYVGAINWGLVGIFNFNLVVALFGATPITVALYVLIGLSGAYQLFRLITALTANRTHTPL